MAGNQPSWKTDVHRAPTKKWAEAKSYNYEGDDWGGYDEYNEYGTYDEPLPPPRAAPAPTGYRQRGQSLSNQNASQTQGLSRSDSFDAGDEKRNFSAGHVATSSAFQSGHSSSRQGQRQGQMDVRYEINRQQPQSESQYHMHQYQPHDEDSYEIQEVQHQRGDQYDGYQEQQQPEFRRDNHQQAHDYLPNQSYDTRNDPNFNQAYAEPQAPGGFSLAGHRMDPRTPPDTNQHREFSISAASAHPLHAHTKSMPMNSSGDVQTASQFPPRKSSLSGSRPLHLPESQPAQPSLHSSSNRAEVLPEATAQVPQPTSGNRSPFIRPADIYKRMEQERSRERERIAAEARRPSAESTSDQSINNLSTVPQPTEISRGSMDPSSDRPARSNYIAPPISEARTTSVSPARLDSSISEPQEVASEKTNISATIPVSAAIRPSLTTIPEQRSEYGLLGFSVSNPLLARAIGAKVYGPSTSGATTENTAHRVNDGYSVSNPAVKENEATGDMDARGNPPLLPQLNRISGFDSDMWGGVASSTSPQSAANSAVASTNTVDNHDTSEHTADYSGSSDRLHHQPSLGFRTVVAHAFDRGAERNGPRSQVSTDGRLDVTNASDLSRSNTDSTAGISPIISRFPRGFGRQEQTEEGSDSTGIPSRIVQEPENPDLHRERLLSADTMREQPTRFAGKSSRDPSTDSVASGYRRKLDVPSPGNSPARTPAIENEAHIPQGMVGQTENTGPSTEHHDEVYPADPELPDLHGSSLATREDDLADAVNAHPHEYVAGAGSAAQQAQTDFITSRHESDAATHSHEESIASIEPPPARAGSPSKSRVRALAEKYDDLTLSRQSTAQSPTGSVASWVSSRKRSPSPKRNFGGPNASDQEHGYGSYEETSDHRERSNVHSLDRRPRLPGEWISYADTPGSSRQSYTEDQDEEDSNENELPKAHGSQPEAISTSVQTPISHEVDLSPNTEKRKLQGKSLDSSVSDPMVDSMAALAAAGSAMAASFMSTIGLTSPASESDSETNKSWNSSDDEETPSAVDRGPIGENVRMAPDCVKDDVPADTAKFTPDQGNRTQPTLGQSEASSRHSSLGASHNEKSSPPRPQRMEIPSRPVQPSFSSVMSIESSPDDTENDRLSKQIVRSLSPTSFGLGSEKYGESRASQVLTNQRSSNFDSRESTLLPREYDSYWAEKGHEINESEADISPTRVSTKSDSVKEKQDVEPNIAPQHPLMPERTITPPMVTKTNNVDITPSPPRSPPGLLDKRFSFEKREEVIPFSQTFNDVVSPIETADTTSLEMPHGHSQGNLSQQETSEAQDPKSSVQAGRFDVSSLVHDQTWRRSQNQADRSSQSTVTSQNITASGVSHTPVSTIENHTEEDISGLDSNPDKAESNIAYEKGNTVSQVSTAPLLPPIDFSGAAKRSGTSSHQVEAESQRSSDINQVHSSVLPTPDGSTLPPASTTLDKRSTHDSYDSPLGRDESGRFSPNFGRGETTPISRGLQFPDPPAWMIAPSELHPGPRQKLTPFKEIMGMKNSNERIRTYQDTREGFANMHTGLSDWLSHMVKVDPALAHIEPVQTRTTGGLAGTVLHKLSPSVAKFTRSNTGSGATQQQPYYQQYLDSAAMVPGQNSADVSSTAASEEHDKTGRRPSVTGQSKGKDILHSAGLLGGRATSSAKGFFAKSRSKFKGNSSDKSPTPRPTEQQEAHSSTQSTRSQSVAQASDQATLIPTQVEEPSVLVGPTLSGDVDIPAGYGAAQLAPSVPVLPNDDSLSPKVLQGKLDLFSTSSGLVHSHDAAKDVSKDIASSEDQNGSVLEPRDKSVLQQDVDHENNSHGAAAVDAQNDQHINLRIDSPEETAAAGMTKYVRPSIFMRDSVSSLGSESDSGANPNSETGVFGPRGLALWTNTASSASHGPSRSSLQNQYQDEPRTSVPQLVFGKISNPDETRPTDGSVRQPTIRDYDSRETIRGQAIGTPADLLKHNRGSYFERLDQRATQRSSIEAMPISPISRPESTATARGRPLSPSHDSELGHLQVVPQNQTRHLHDVDQNQRPFIFNFRGVSEDSSLKPDDSASQQPRDSVQDSLSQRQYNSIQDSSSQIPYSSVHSSSIKPTQPRISEVESRPSQSAAMHLGGTRLNESATDNKFNRLGQITGPPPPSNIDDLPVSVRKHYSRFDSHTSEEPTQSSSKVASPREDNYIQQDVHAQHGAGGDLSHENENPSTPTPTRGKRRMSPFERFRSRSRSRGRTSNDHAAGIPGPPMPHSEHESGKAQSTTIGTESRPSGLPTLRRKRRISSPFNLLRGRSRPRSEVEVNDLPVPPVPQTTAGETMPHESIPVASPDMRESFYAMGKRRLSSPFRRLRSRSRGRSGLASEDVPALPTSNITRASTSADHPDTSGATVKAPKTQSTKDNGMEASPKDDDRIRTKDDQSPNQAKKLQDIKVKQRDRSLSWNRLGNKFMPRQSTVSDDDPLVTTRSQSRSRSVGLAGCFNTTDEERPILIARDSQHHLTNFTHEIPIPVSISKRNLPVGETTSEQNAQVNVSARLQHHNAVLPQGTNSDIKRQYVDEPVEQSRAEYKEYPHSHSPIRRRPTTAEKGKSAQQVELPNVPLKRNSDGQKHDLAKLHTDSHLGLVTVPSMASNEMPLNKHELSREAQHDYQTVFRSKMLPSNGKDLQAPLAQASTPPGLRGIKTIHISEPLDFSPEPTSPIGSTRQVSSHYRSSSTHSQPIRPSEQQYQPLPYASMQLTPPQQYQDRVENDNRGVNVSMGPSSTPKSSISTEQYMQRPKSGSQPTSPVLPGPYKSPQVHSLPFRFVSEHQQQPLAQNSIPLRNGPYIPPLRTCEPSLYSSSEQKQVSPSPLVPPPRSPFRPPSTTTSPRSSIYLPPSSQNNFEEGITGGRSSREYRHSVSSRDHDTHDSSPRNAMYSPTTGSNKGGSRLETSDFNFLPAGGRGAERSSQVTSNTARSLRRYGDDDYEGVVMNSTSYPGMEWRPAGLERE